MKKIKKIFEKKLSKKNLLKTFFQSQVAVGVILIIASILALVISNSKNHQLYFDFFNQNLDLNIKFLEIYKPFTLRDWINDALMAVFFFLVGLELKSEILIGELSSRKKMSLPLICACGGVIFPILLFLVFNGNIPENAKGFAIPCATDIAFAYGFIALFGKTFSNSLKVFLVALAVIDDLIAILIIAFFYTAEIELFYIGYATLACVGLYILNQKKSANLFLYGLFGVLLWLMILKSGVHATIAGVVLALFIPLKIKKTNFLENLAHKISPSVNFLILPIFAFTNSGVKIENFSINYLNTPMVLGIGLGLFFGKQIGVMLTAFLAHKLGFAKLPRGTDWLEFYGVSLFTGIGFTMSLFIASLAFGDNQLIFDEAKIGVLFGSILSVFGGSLVAVILLKRGRK
ncbi:MAG: Na+/H+ antiporter NhaA [Proteobacteria bacterium]|nr:Na+/H+ antiporter NhaA [Pseudomonadota bacterium]NCA28776.1 Na+/H+ antiporter NhaA [Pseudomonadota bacterium]